MFSELSLVSFFLFSITFSVYCARLDESGGRSWISSLAKKTSEWEHSTSHILENLTKSIPIKEIDNALNLFPVAIDTFNPLQILQHYSKQMKIDTESEDAKANADTVTFDLYTNNNNYSDHDVLLFHDINSILRSRFKYGKPLKVLIHGYRRDSQWMFPQETKNRYLAEKNGTLHRNVLVVGWPKLADFNPLLYVPGYATAALRNVPIVGKRVGEFLSLLIEHKMTRLDLIHVIGHSLGSHVGGVAGGYLHEKHASPMFRITGLDPAGPLFYFQILGRPLSRDDAAFVDVIHTSQGTYGKMGQIGHADFYPNGGALVQQGCRGNGSLEFGFGVITDVLTLGKCSHSSAFLLFANSIGSTTLKGCKCPNYGLFKAGLCDCADPKNVALLGENCDPRSRGKFYLDMRS